MTLGDQSRVPPLSDVNHWRVFQVGGHLGCCSTGTSTGTVTMFLRETKSEPRDPPCYYYYAAN